MASSDVAGRAAQAGAHFSLIEENVAVGPDAPAIHEEWMHSPGHRTNLLNPQVNRVGIAVLSSRGIFYAVADYSQAVRALSPFQVEASIGNLIRPSGLIVLADPSVAPAPTAPPIAGPPALRIPVSSCSGRAPTSPTSSNFADRLSSGQYHRAAIGNCPAQSDQSAFTAYRIAVLLY